MKLRVNIKMCILMSLLSRRKRSLVMYKPSGHNQDNWLEFSKTALSRNDSNYKQRTVLHIPLPVADRLLQRPEQISLRISSRRSILTTADRTRNPNSRFHFCTFCILKCSTNSNKENGTKMLYPEGRTLTINRTALPIIKHS